MAISFSDLVNDSNIEMCSFKVPFKFCTEEQVVIKLKATVTYPRDVPVYLKAYLEFLTTNETVKSMLECDRCGVYADKYLLAMVFRYLMRVGVEPADYCPYLFFVALFLAYDMVEEGLLHAKHYFCRLATGSNSWKGQVRFNKTKSQLFKLLDFQANVPTEWCEKLFQIFPDHSAWQRTRDVGHAGAIRYHTLHLPGGRTLFDWVVRPTCWKCASFKTPGQPNSSDPTEILGLMDQSYIEESWADSTSPKTPRDSWGSTVCSNSTIDISDDIEEDISDTEEEVEDEDDIEVMYID